MSKLPDITVVIPYFNEEKSLLTTIHLISSQTLMPKVVIFVDSTSTDQSSVLVDQWIKTNQTRFETQFLNINEGTRNPGSSKNVGINHTKTSWVAFMDCGLLFDKTWLESQWDYVQKHNVDIVTGAAYFEGSGLIDKCAIAQTYGYKRKNDGIIPSSLMKKNVFEKTGLFLKRRSAYDFSWRMTVKRLGIKRGVNESALIHYNGVNFAPTLFRIIKKNIIYYAPSIRIPDYKTSYYFFLIFLLGLIITFLLPHSLLFSIPFYILARGFIIPHRKSKGLLLLKEEPMAIFMLPIVGACLDLGRLLGIFLGIYRYHLVGNPSCDY